MDIQIIGLMADGGLEFGVRRYCLGSWQSSSASFAAALIYREPEGEEPEEPELLSAW